MNVPPIFHMGPEPHSLGMVAEKEFVMRGGQVSTSQADIEDQRRKQRSLEAELIVKRLGVLPAPLQGDYCGLCYADVFANDQKTGSHEPECPWRWARDWAAAHDTG